MESILLQKQPDLAFLGDLAEVISKLRKKCPAAVFKRGEEIAAKKGVVIDPDICASNMVVFNVAGNIQNSYMVIFRKMGKGIGFSCECPYKESGVICKHVVASALYLTDFSGGENKKGSEKKGGREIVIPDNIKDYNWLKPYLKGRGTQFSTDPYPEVEAGKFIYRVEEKDFGRPKEFIVELKVKDKILSASCTCKSTNPNLCQHALSALRILTHTTDPIVLKQVSADHMKERKHAIGKSFGIADPYQEFDDYFKPCICEKQIMYIGHKKGEGLYNINVVKKQLEDTLKPVSSPEERIKLELAIPEAGAGEYRTGYVLSFTQKDEYDDFDPWSWDESDIEKEERSDFAGLSIIEGKLNKKGDKLVSEITVVDELEQMQGDLNDEVFEALRLKTMLEKACNEAELEMNGVFQATKAVVAFLKEKDFVYWARSLDSFAYIRKSDLNPVKAVSDSVTLEFVFEEEKYFFKLEAFLNVNGRQLSLDDKDLSFPQLFTGLYKDQLFHLNSMKEFHVLTLFSDLPVKRCKKENLGEFYREIVQPLGKQFKVIRKMSTELEETRSLTPFKKKLFISEMDKFVIFRPEVEYKEGFSFSLLDAGSESFEEDGKIVLMERDEHFENDYLDLFRKLHVKFSNAGNQGFLYLKMEEMMENLWFFNAFEKLGKAGVEVFGLNDLKKFKYSVYKPQVRIFSESRKDWFDTRIEISYGNNLVSLQAVKKALERNETFIKLDDGTFGILPEEWLEKFKRVFRAGKDAKDHVKISSLNFNALDGLLDPADSPEVWQELERKKERLRAFKGLTDVPVPQGINANLRSYQKEGLNWLNFLDEFGWGGILADDMGLGKTLQVITFLQLQKEQKRGLSLVVVPTSLLFNWKHELQKFAPDLKFCIHHGLDRAKVLETFSGLDIILTSYGTLCNDLDLFKTLGLNYLILDESQAIKNIVSQRYKAVTALQARNRLALTGTPLENNTLELYAQMNFANPGFLLSVNNFREDYAKPIDVEGNTERANELTRKISPFILRRMKKEVLTELPDKTEETLYCIMPEKQKNLYDACRNEYRDRLLNLIDTEGVEKSVFYVLEGLTKLRQICDSPELIGVDTFNSSEAVKIKELKRHITEKTGKHKILVFSQFVKMLHLIEKELKSIGVTYEYLDGKTPQKAREEKVRNFQEDENCRVFLISLKAGGVGLNLTQADYVYIVDPWWNPAVENQAIDRCYRMGQKKNVTAFRMICKDTIEEKIFELQQQKRELSENILDADKKLLSGLTREDIATLFA